MAKKRPIFRFFGCLKKGLICILYRRSRGNVISNMLRGEKTQRAMICSFPLKKLPVPTIRRLCPNNNIHSLRNNSQASVVQSDSDCNQQIPHLLGNIGGHQRRLLSLSHLSFLPIVSFTLSPSSSHLSPLHISHLSPHLCLMKNSVLFENSHLCQFSFVVQIQVKYSQYTVGPLF